MRKPNLQFKEFNNPKEEKSKKKNQSSRGLEFATPYSQAQSNLTRNAIFIFVNSNNKATDNDIEFWLPEVHSGTRNRIQSMFVFESPPTPSPRHTFFEKAFCCYLCAKIVFRKYKTKTKLRTWPIDSIEFATWPFTITFAPTSETPLIVLNVLPRFRVVKS